MAPPNNQTGCLSGLTQMFNKLKGLLLGRQGNNVQPRENAASIVFTQEYDPIRHHSSNSDQDTDQTTSLVVENVEGKSEFVGVSKHDEVAEESIKFLPEDIYKEFEKMQQLLYEVEECPTCFEEYSPENPRITTKCHHDFHLGCIYEWMERSDKCPVCCRVIVFDETF